MGEWISARVADLGVGQGALPGGLFLQSPSMGDGAGGYQGEEGLQEVVREAASVPWPVPAAGAGVLGAEVEGEIVAACLSDDPHPVDIEKLWGLLGLGDPLRPGSGLERALLSAGSCSVPPPVLRRALLPKRPGRAPASAPAGPVRVSLRCLEDCLQAAAAAAPLVGAAAACLSAVDSRVLGLAELARGRRTRVVPAGAREAAAVLAQVARWPERVLGPGRRARTVVVREAGASYGGDMPSPGEDALLVVFTAAGPSPPSGRTVQFAMRVGPSAPSASGLPLADLHIEGTGGSGPRTERLAAPPRGGEAVVDALLEAAAAAGDEALVSALLAAPGGARLSVRPAAPRALLAAAASGHAAVVRLLAPAAAGSAGLAAALCAACAGGHEEATRVLLEAGADPEAGAPPLLDGEAGPGSRVPGAPCESPLHAAVAGGSAGVVRLLLSHGASADIKVPPGAAFHYGVGAALARARGGRGVRVLSVALADPDSGGGGGGGGGWQVCAPPAAWLDDEDRLGPGRWGIPGATPFHLAAALGHVEICRLLLGAGGDTAARDGLGGTALCYGALFGRDETVALLGGGGGGAGRAERALAAGYALWGGHVGMAERLAAAAAAEVAGVGGAAAPEGLFGTPLPSAASSLVDCPADMPWRHPLHLAARRGLAGLCGALLSAGCDPEEVDARGDTALTAAVLGGSEEAVLAVLAGGPPGLALAPGSGGRLPAEIACEVGGTAVAALLPALLSAAGGAAGGGAINCALAARALRAGNGPAAEALLPAAVAAGLARGPALCWAARHGLRGAAAAALAAPGGGGSGPANYVDEDGLCPLQYALAMGHPAVAADLVAHGARLPRRALAPGAAAPASPSVVLAALLMASPAAWGSCRGMPAVCVRRGGGAEGFWERVRRAYGKGVAGAGELGRERRGGRAGGGSGSSDSGGSASGGSSECDGSDDEEVGMQAGGLSLKRSPLDSDSGSGSDCGSDGSGDDSGSGSDCGSDGSGDDSGSDVECGGGSGGSISGASVADSPSISAGVEREAAIDSPTRDPSQGGVEDLLSAVEAVMGRELIEVDGSLYSVCDVAAAAAAPAGAHAWSESQALAAARGAAFGPAACASAVRAAVAAGAASVGAWAGGWGAEEAAELARGLPESQGTLQSLSLHGLFLVGGSGAAKPPRCREADAEGWEALRVAVDSHGDMASLADALCGVAERLVAGKGERARQGPVGRAPPPPAASAGQRGEGAGGGEPGGPGASSGELGAGAGGEGATPGAIPYPGAAPWLQCLACLPLPEVELPSSGLTAPGLSRLVAHILSTAAGEAMTSLDLSDNPLLDPEASGAARPPAGGAGAGAGARPGAGGGALDPTGLEALAAALRGGRLGALRQLDTRGEWSRAVATSAVAAGAAVALAAAAARAGVALLDGADVTAGLALRAAAPEPYRGRPLAVLAVLEAVADLARNAREAARSVPPVSVDLSGCAVDARGLGTICPAIAAGHVGVLRLRNNPLASAPITAAAAAGGGGVAIGEVADMSGILALAEALAAPAALVTRLDLLGGWVASSREEEHTCAALADAAAGCSSLEFFDELEVGAIRRGEIDELLQPDTSPPGYMLLARLLATPGGRHIGILDLSECDITAMELQALGAGLGGAAPPLGTLNLSHNPLTSRGRGRSVCGLLALAAALGARRVGALCLLGEWGWEAEALPGGAAALAALGDAAAKSVSDLDGVPLARIRDPTSREVEVKVKDDAGFVHVIAALSATAAGHVGVLRVRRMAVDEVEGVGAGAISAVLREWDGGGGRLIAAMAPIRDFCGQRGVMGFEGRRVRDAKSLWGRAVAEVLGEPLGFRV